MLRTPVLVSSLMLVLTACPRAQRGDVDPPALASMTPDDACALERAFLAAPPDALAGMGLDPRELERVQLLRQGADGIAGTGDDAPARPWRDVIAEVVGREALARIAARAGALPRCGRVQVQLLAFNDFHGALQPPAGKNGEIETASGPVPAGGVEYLATWVATLRDANPNTLVVSAGDNIGATPLLSAVFHDEPTIEALGALGLQISAVGNHEFDEGTAELERMQRGGCHPQEGCFGGDGFAGASFEYLAANVRRVGDAETLFPPYAIRRFGPTRVAFIGLTLEGTPEVVTAGKVADVSFGDEVETINALVPRLSAGGIRTIVVLLHEGGFAAAPYDGCVGISGPVFDIARRLDKAIDVLVSGHTNAAHICNIDGLLVTSAAHNGRLVSDIDLTLDEVSGEVVDKRATNVIVRRDVPKAAPVTAIVQKYDALVRSYADVVVARPPKDLLRGQDASGQSALGSIIADAQLAAESDASTGRAVIALMNPGGIRGDLMAGEVTFGEVFTVQPFGNDLVTMTLTGAQIERALEEQWLSEGKVRVKPKMLQVSATLAYRWDPGKPPGDRIDPASLTIEGKPVDPQASYRVVMNNFLAGGGDGFSTFEAGTERRFGLNDVDALVDYLKKHPLIEPPPPGRITRL